VSAAGVGQIQFEGVVPISHPRSRLSTPAGLRFVAMAALAAVAIAAFLIQTGFQLGGRHRRGGRRTYRGRQLRLGRFPQLRPAEAGLGFPRCIGAELGRG